MKMGILRTDAVLEKFQPSHGDYPAMFREVFGRVEPSLEFVDHDVRLSVPEDIDCDIYLITGSRHSVYEDLPWLPPLVDFLKDALDQCRSVIGICFGHQLIAHFFGGEVGPAEVGWCVGVQTGRVIDEELRGTFAHDEVRLLASHKDQVLRLPEGAKVFLSSASCPIGGFVLGEQIVTIQGHPEFSKPYARDLMNHRAELLGESVHQAGLQSLELGTDEERVVRMLLDSVRPRVAQEARTS